MIKSSGKVPEGRRKGRKMRKYLLIICFMFLNISTCVAAEKVLPLNGKLIFSEHEKTYYEGHSIKEMDLYSKNITDYKIKTNSYGDFFLSGEDEIAWTFYNSEIVFYNVMTRETYRKKVAMPGIIWDTLRNRINLFTSGNKFVYPKWLGPAPALIIGGKPLNGEFYRKIGDLGSVNIYDFELKKDSVVLNNELVIGSIEFSPDGTKLLYTRPADDKFLNQNYLNGLSMGFKKRAHDVIPWAIFMLNLETKEIRKIVSGEYPKWSPDGKRVAFVDSRNKIAIIDLNSGKVTELKTQGVKKQKPHRMAWHHDGKNIFYLVKTYPSVFGMFKAIGDGSLDAKLSNLWVARIDDLEEELIMKGKLGDIKSVSK